MDRVPAVPLSQVALPTNEQPFYGISVGGLAALANPANPANEQIEARCSQFITMEDGSRLRCERTFPAPKFFSQVMACDECRERETEKMQMEKYRTYWEGLCPADFRETAIRDPRFPQEQHRQLATYNGTDSLFFHGPSGAGKTRLALVLLKRCLVRHSVRIGVMWPEDLKDAATSRVRKEIVQKWGWYELLLMDDCFLTGAADGKTADVLRDILDFRFRHKRHVIITSQVGKDDYKEAASKGEKLTANQEALLESLFRRLKDRCQMVSFLAAAAPGAGESSF